MNLFFFKNLTISISTLLILSACSSQKAPNNQIIDQHTTKESLDVEGYYYGVIPCASCPGIETWLQISKNDEKINYMLKQQYLENDEAVFTSTGNAQWQKNSSILELENKNEKNTELFIGEGYASYNNKSPQDDLYILNKMKTFSNNTEMIFINPNELKLVNKKVSFEGIINFKEIPQGGHQSLKANFVIDCKANKYSIPKISYYENKFLTGKTLEKTNKNTTEISLNKGDIINQVAKEYCQR